MARKQPDEFEQVEPGAWAYTCSACGFVSRGWPSKRKAEERRRQHLAEHTHRAPMPELKDAL